jgi:hypothetical protein
MWKYSTSKCGNHICWTNDVHVNIVSYRKLSDQERQYVYSLLGLTNEHFESVIENRLVDAGLKQFYANKVDDRLKNAAPDKKVNRIINLVTISLSTFGY